ncbi:hypothetical protein [Rhodococcoides fascians]|uniref:hypothetical protein n=1 Tax=Rhodococcoides fascians TaxID=1828 RepID=UPI00050BDB36|nr:hypothetical protein [Rhodococcus fascians]
MNAQEWAVIITALGSLVGAVIAGVALLKKTQSENVQTLSEKIARQNLRLDEQDARHEQAMRQMRERIDERDGHIGVLERKVIRISQYAFALRQMLADRGIESPDPPTEEDPADEGR